MCDHALSQQDFFPKRPSEGGVSFSQKRQQNTINTWILHKRLLKRYCCTLPIYPAARVVLPGGSYMRISDHSSCFLLNHLPMTCHAVVTRRYSATSTCDLLTFWRCDGWRCWQREWDRCGCLDQISQLMDVDDMFFLFWFWVIKSFPHCLSAGMIFFSLLRSWSIKSDTYLITCHKNQENVGKYTIHGWYGYCKKPIIFSGSFRSFSVRFVWCFHPSSTNEIQSFGPFLCGVHFPKLKHLT